ncbi:hypothetical protein [Ferrimicrobium sp.]|uniref:hypothetical protein n=1 Tax=Ferrimicrobium sp. TaxID=2926050 RepID=UPI00262D1AB9|nr:hypothetical protein [Ferrimicrobium sp.]
MVTKPTDAQRAIMREKARADTRAMEEALKAKEHLDRAERTREVTIAKLDQTVTEAKGAYQLALDRLTARVGKELVAELLGTELARSPRPRSQT